MSNIMCLAKKPRTGQGLTKSIRDWKLGFTRIKKLHRKVHAIVSYTLTGENK